LRSAAAGRFQLRPRAARAAPLCAEVTRAAPLRQAHEALHPPPAPWEVDGPAEVERRRVARARVRAALAGMGAPARGSAHAAAAAVRARGPRGG
jgi:hypothetical protein